MDHQKIREALMASKVTIIVPFGFKEVLNKHMDNVAISSADEVKETAKTLCPIDSGRLQRSIVVIKDGTNYAIGSDLDYSEYVEYGTVHQAPQPFIRPALGSVLSKQDS